MSGACDAIVIGAGHNGLTAAALLAKAGRKVLVLEASERPGGLAAAGLLGETSVPRFAHLVYGLNPKVAREIGLKLKTLPVPDVALSPDGAHVVMTGGNARMADGARHPDAEAYFALHSRLVRFARLLAPMALKAPPALAPGNDGFVGDLARMARLGLNLKLLGKRDMREFLRILLSNAHDVILDEIPDGPLAGALAADAVRGAFTGPRAPGTVFSLLYRMAEGGGAALPLGGPAALADAFVAAAIRHGAVIRAGARVASIDLDGDRASGVTLAGGEKISAPLVLSSAGAAETMALAGVASFDIEAARRLRNLRCKGSAAKVNLLLKEVPEIPGLNAAQLAGRLLIAPSATAVERAFNPVKYGQMPENPVIEAVIPTLTQPDPSERHVLSAVVQFVPLKPEGGWNARARKALLATTLDTLERYAPGLKKLVVASEVLGPADIALETGAPGGHWHHGEMGFDQLLTVRPVNLMARYAFGPTGLYLCGAAAHPGGDVTGLPGRNAARMALAAEART